MIYFFLLPKSWAEAYGDIILQIILLGLAFFVSITFAPFRIKNEINDFWQFNKILFLRLFFTTFYSGILFIGIILAYASIEQLFEVDIHEKLYLETLVFITGILCTHFFLCGIPKNFKKITKEKKYPKGIKFFSQYILIPLLIIYAIILSVY